MEKDYTKFLSQKLFLIEALSLKSWLSTKDNNMKEIHDICISSLQELKDLLNKEGSND